MNYFKKTKKKAALAATIGSVVEFYDFFLYATAAAIIFPKLYFGSSDPFIATIQSFSTLAIGFLARPLGAVIFGHVGDRKGRKYSLVLTMYLMGVSSVLIGLLPTYEAIGHWAPILLILLRFLQGIGVGGEWGGAILLALEWSSKKQQGLLASLPQMGVSIGLLLSSSAISLAILISGDNFYTWGWRLPFLLSVFLIILGFIIRSDIPEPPSFKKAKNNQEVSKFPVLKVLKDHPKDVLLSAFIRLSENGPFTIYTILMVNYATENFNIESSFLVNSNLFASLLMIVLIPSFGYLSDRYGIKKIYMVGIGLTLIWSVPYVSLVNTQIPLIILLATLISMIPHSMQVAPQGALMANSFPIYLRYSGLALGSQLGAIISGGIAPLLTMLLLHQFNSIYIISAYIFFASLVSLIATYLMKDINENSKSNYTLLNKMEETK